MIIFCSRWTLYRGAGNAGFNGLVHRNDVCPGHAASHLGSRLHHQAQPRRQIRRSRKRGHSRPQRLQRRCRISRILTTVRPSLSLSLSLSPLSPLSVIQLRLFISYLTFPNRVGSSRTHSKASLGSEAKMPPPESDTDSMAEYGDGETGNSSILRPTFAFIPKFKKTLLSRNAVHVT